jgi:hypothetical protein
MKAWSAHFELHRLARGAAQARGMQDPDTGVGTDQVLWRIQDHADDDNVFAELVMQTGISAEQSANSESRSDTLPAPGRLRAPWFIA